MKSSVQRIHLIHAHPLQKLVGTSSVYPSKGFYRFSHHVATITNFLRTDSGEKLLPGLEVKADTDKVEEPLIQAFHADIESAQRAGAGALFTAFGVTSVCVSQTADEVTLSRYVDGNTSIVIVVCELPQLSALANQICNRCEIAPPGLGSFPDGGMVTIDLKNRRFTLHTGDSE